jgi:pimeloyl-ACP methyl ester carboxylesterase
MGGFVALDMAIRYPGFVKGLFIAGSSSVNPERNKILFNSWADELDAGTDPESWFRELFKWFFTKKFIDDNEKMQEAIAYSINYPYPQDKNAFRNQVEAINSYDCIDKINRIETPALLIYGEEDRLFPPAPCLKTLAPIQQADSRIIKEAAHSVHWEQPEAFSCTVIEHLKSFDSG